MAANGTTTSGKQGTNGFQSWVKRHLILLLFAAYLVFALVVQLWSLPAWEARFSAQATATAAAASGAEIRVVYPEQLLARPTPGRQAIAVWLTEGTPAAGSVPTPAGTPQAEPTRAAYVIELSSSANWQPFIVDGSGIAADGRSVITPAAAPATPLVYYLAANPRRNPLIRPMVRVSITVSERDTPAQAEVLPLFVRPEPYYGFLIRRLLSAATDLTAIGAVILAALIGKIIARPFEQDAERRQQAREEQKRIGEKLNALRALRGDYQQLEKMYRDLRGDTDFSVDRNALEAEWARLAPEWLQQLVKFNDDKAIPETLSGRDAAGFGMQIFKEGGARLQPKAYDWWAALLARCASSAKASGSPDSLGDALGVLIADPDGGRIWESEPVTKARDQEYGDKSRDFLGQAERIFKAKEVVSWPRLLPAEPRVDDLHSIGQERAEAEPRLREFADKKHANELKKQHPTVIFGADGTGKTATALLLAAGGSPPDDPTSNKGLPGAPPLPGGACVIYSAAKGGLGMPMTAMDWAEHLAASWADYHVRFLRKNPEFLAPAPAPQAYLQAVLQLLVWRYGSAEAAAGALQGDFVLRSMILGAGQPGTLALASVDHLIGLMGRAHPTGYEDTFIALDQDLPPQVNESPGIEAVVGANLQVLADLMARLAHRRIYVKLFLPIAAQRLLTWPGWLEAKTLEWDAEMVRETLTRRLGDKSYLLSDRYREILVERSLNNPRRMIRAGNRLIAGLRNGTINVDDPNQIVQAVYEAGLHDGDSG